MADVPESTADDLTANDHACMLVGRYFYYFANLERTLHGAVAYLFDLKIIQAEMLMANITVRDKANILKTAVDFYSRNRSDNWTAGAIKALNQIINETEQRNFLAHTQFFAAKNGVEFFKVKAKGKFEIPDIIWTDDDFDKRYGHLMELAQSVRSIVAEMKSHKIKLKIAEELSRPKTNFSSLGLLGGLYPQGLASLGSSPLGSILGIDTQTPPTPQPIADESKM